MSDSQQPPHLRTAGAGVVGRIHRGAIGTIVAPSSTKGPVRPSIPSRIETVINPSSINRSKEPKAFGSTAYRFTDTNNTADGRSLGTEYQACDSSLKATKNKLNVSKHGTAAFASAKRAGFSADAPIKQLPGPGQYESWTTSVMDNIKSKHLTSCSYAFAKSSKKPSIHGGQSMMNDSPSAENELTSSSSSPHHSLRKQYSLGPGPGEYHLPDAFTANETNSHVLRKPATAAMTSRASRMLDRVPLRDPREQDRGPGSYLPDSCVNELSCKTKNKISSGPSYFNKSKSERSSLGLMMDQQHHDTGSTGGIHNNNNPNQNLPAPLMRVPEGELSPHVAKALAQVAASSSSSLRNNNYDNASATNANSSKPSAVFRETNHDRFGNPIVRYAVRADDSKVGPGSYSIIPEVKKKLVSSSWALSTEARDAALKTNSSCAPGPAFYCPTKPSRLTTTSYHAREDLPKSDLTNAKYRYEAAQQRYRHSKSTWL